MHMLCEARSLKNVLFNKVQMYISLILIYQIFDLSVTLLAQNREPDTFKVNMCQLLHGEIQIFINLYNQIAATLNVSSIWKHNLDN